MAIKYITKEMPSDWNLAKCYFPNFKLTNSKIYEVIFSRLGAGQSVDVKLEVPYELIEKKCSVYFADGRGNYNIMPAKRKNNELCFSTNKVGLYMIIDEKEASSNKKLSQVIFTASNASKNMGLKIERAFMGM